MPKYQQSFKSAKSVDKNPHFPLPLQSKIIVNFNTLRSKVIDAVALRSKEFVKFAQFAVKK
ncbi:MAG: hypothetical protein JXR39_04950, partial [Marinilabiliaceae bacterium]|nr:hypothetical protein [Marinilabiliaceae bacterium]